MRLSRLGLRLEPLQRKINFHLQSGVIIMCRHCPPPHRTEECAVRNDKVGEWIDRIIALIFDSSPCSKPTRFETYPRRLHIF